MHVANKEQSLSVERGLKLFRLEVVRASLYSPYALAGMRGICGLFRQPAKVSIFLRFFFFFFFFFFTFTKSKGVKRDLYMVFYALQHASKVSS
ncbi:hypothetical protein HanIR_Chr02g0053621 [Helianthus annuus]|nr:hypothetical protein HanIR_Chr02g0053621 [Helianthus annuus]